ncbi:MAG: hypothetical protein BWY92_00608 [Firmicutes bacterium ADurb.BinA052]|nr:MAG: hypothetical protein BWY92_00608 [Firmicutes bacterium ADurb.BinA052]
MAASSSSLGIASKKPFNTHMLMGNVKAVFATINPPSLSWSPVLLNST